MSYGFILMMVKKEGTPSTKLGPMMGMEPTSLSRTIKLMEDEGFILRKESEKDKRQVLIFLTDKGLEKRRIIRSSLLSFNEELERKISDFHKKFQEQEEKLRQEETLRRQLHNTIQELKGNIRVFCRIRPAIGQEPPESLWNHLTLPESADNNKLQLLNNNNSKTLIEWI